MAEASKSVTKQDLIKRVTAKTKKKGTEVTEVIAATLESIREALEAGEEVRLVNFGVFRAQLSAARVGVNPQTRQRMQVEAKMRVKFTPGKELNEAVSGQPAAPAAAAAKPAAKAASAKSAPAPKAPASAAKTPVSGKKK